MRTRVFSRRRKTRAFSVEASDERAHTLVVGGTGTGKSEGVKRRVISESLKNEIAVVVLDPHEGSLAQKARNHLVENGIPFLYDKLSNPVGLSWNFLRNSEKTGIQADIENDLLIRAFADVTTRRRGLRLHEKPVIEDWTIAALELFIHQDEELPLDVLPHLLEQKHPAHELALEMCTNEEVRWKCAGINTMSTYVWQNTVAAAHRMIKRVCHSPAFRVRSGGAFDFYRFLDNRGILLVEGGNISKDATRTIMGGIIIQVIQYVRTHKRPVLLVIDEAATFDLIGEHEVNALAELRKYGLCVIVIVQALSFPPEINEQILTNTPRKEIYRAGSKDTARLCAELLATYDPYLIHHVDERRKYAPDGFEEIDVQNEGWQVDEEGRQVWREGKSKVFRPKHREEIEETVHYMGIEDQIKLLSREVMRLNVGERYVIEKQVWKEQLPKPEREGYRCFAGYLDRKVRKTLNEMMQGPEYGTGKRTVERWLRGCTNAHRQQSSSSHGDSTRASRPADGRADDFTNESGSDISDQF